MTDLSKLSEKFHPRDIEWRIATSGKKGDRVWAKCFAYVDNRAIMARLDDVVGPMNWTSNIEQLRTMHNGTDGFLCTISVRDKDGEWVHKSDGSDSSDIEPLKGGISGAMKRAAVHWGIGRYLYDLPEGWANIHSKGIHSAKLKDGNWHKWSPPILPAWALPSEALALENMTAYLKDSYDEAKHGPALVLGPGGNTETLRALVQEARNTQGTDYYLVLYAYEGLRSLIT